jgi:ABC-type transport system involved in multi-copper enzyme maturation permease subunit
VRGYLKMNKIKSLAFITFKGGIRDRTILGIVILAFLLLISTPLFSSFSMRQILAVAVDYNLSTISFIGIILSIFAGINLIARDIDRRSIYTVISLPISRSQYLIAKFLGLVYIIIFSSFILTLFGSISILITSHLYPQDLNSDIHWYKFFLSIFYIILKLIIITSSVFLFTSFATSTFLPLILSFIFYFIGESTEEVKVFIEGIGKEKISPLIKAVAQFAYYIFPNLSAFDLKPHAIYGLPLDYMALFFVFLYGIFYTGVILTLSVIIFSRREFL